MRGSGSKECTECPMDSAPTAPRPPFEPSDFQTCICIFQQYNGVSDHPPAGRSASPPMAPRDHHNLAQYPAAQTDLGWGPGAGPWNYRKVPEPALSSLLAAVANPNTIGSVDIIDFQPQADEPSEDRHVVQDWALQNGTWKFLAVFDGRQLRPRVARLHRYLLIIPAAPQAMQGVRRRTTSLRTSRLNFNPHYLISSPHQSVRSTRIPCQTSFPKPSFRMMSP